MKAKHRWSCVKRKIALVAREDKKEDLLEGFRN
jgi:hypothetical protein